MKLTSMLKEAFGKHALEELRSYIEEEVLNNREFVRNALALIITGNSESAKALKKKAPRSKKKSLTCKTLCNKVAFL